MTTLVLLKPAFGQPCNGCGYCCSVQPCELAQELLKCTQGPCIALESDGLRTSCGLVRNPLGYLFAAAHPEQAAAALEAAPDLETGHQLSVQFATALGLGKGCDADDSPEGDSGRWQGAASTPEPSV